MNWRINNIHALLLAGMIVSAQSLSAGPLPTVELRGGTALVRNSSVELAILRGAITGIKDLRTGEDFCATADFDGAMKRVFGSETPEWASAGSVCEIRKGEGGDAVLVYRGSSARGDYELQYEFADGGDGAVRVRTTWRFSNPEKPPAEIQIPIIGLNGKSVILGCGARYVRDDAPADDACVRPSNNLYGPPAAVAEGGKGCIFFWSEDFQNPKNIRLSHDPGADHLRLCSSRPAMTPEKGLVRSVRWNILPAASWADAAKAYRVSFEKIMGAKPLWLNGTEWVRKIHAVHYDLPGGIHGNPSPADSDAYYGRLASMIDPSKLLLFYWNGNVIILFGDHRYMKVLEGPKPQVIDALEKYGFRWMGYHPYVLIYSPKGSLAQLEQIKAKGWGLPEGYEFAPDYEGEPGKFHDYFRPVAHGYYQPKDKTMDEMDGLWVLHPGSSKTRGYILRNFKNYCKAHRVSGCYFDIMGVGCHTWDFPEDRKVMDGFDGYTGESELLKLLRRELPELAVMSECQSEWTTAYTFYTWEGSTHITLPRDHPSIKAIVNHPFRTALWGSYTWTREEEIDVADLALLGSLPVLRLGDDWSLARARLFTEEELFNGLPEKWDTAALAYYRGRDGRMFQFRKLPYGDGYVELDTGSAGSFKPRLVRLAGQTISPLEQPARIQDWVAYRDGRPFGLDPSRKYGLILEPPPKEELMLVYGLPEGAFVRTARHAKGYSVLELGSLSGREIEGKVSVRMGKKCLKACDFRRDFAGPFPAGTRLDFETVAPGGMVFVWEAQKSLDGSSPAQFASASGHLLSDGRPDRFWCYNSSILCGKTTVEGVEYPALSVGYGRHRGYAESWIKVAPEGRCVLKFDLGYPLPSDKKTAVPPPVICSVLVCGREVWKETVKPEAGWRPREITLDEFTGREALVTFSVQASSETDSPPGPSSCQPALFGRTRIELENIQHPTLNTQPAK